jgi:pimeloyl-ACP methyl ester carboxylesterase
MKTYVLVHGAWHGGWCWSRVATALRATEADVYTPTLTGLGERAHLASRSVGIETHIRDILGVLEYEDLTDVILVGHSYAGIIVTAVADRVPTRVSRLVYLDAVVPKDGQCLLDCFGSEFRSHIEAHVKALGEGWLIPAVVATGRLLGLDTQDDIDWTIPRLRPHPYRTFHEPVRLGRLASQTIPRVFIKCVGTDGGTSDIDAYKRTATDIEDYYALAAGHDAMITMPRDVAGLLRRLTP